jgi:hypothetical protein
MKALKIIIAGINLALFAVCIYKVSTQEQPETEQRFVLKSNSPIFRMEVGHDEWNGKLEPGRYTKSGILIIKQ